MTWERELEELRAREALAEEMGGPDKVARQHSRGKMDARARLDAICDPGSFREIGKIAGKGHYDENGDLQGVTPAPFLFGKATVNGRPVVATADDFTIRGGAADAGIKRKMVQAEQMVRDVSEALFLLGLRWKDSSLQVMLSEGLEQRGQLFSAKFVWSVKRIV